MFCYIVLALLAASPALAAVYTEPASFCSQDEFACADGACVSRDRRCDGATHCADGSDEDACADSSNKLDLSEIILNRHTRQTECRTNQFRCRDGTCISFDGKCDGAVDCPDGSDETHALCRHMRCQGNLFRCTYGACVDGTAACNGVKECADNSDELNPQCRNGTREANGKFTCANGAQIASTDHCDGARDCADGSDESIESCADKRCAAYLFQCAYGACVDAGVDCDGIQNCADGSDEADELCNRMSTVTTTRRPDGGTSHSCVLPPFPENGFFTVKHSSADLTILEMSCNAGYGLLGDKNYYCHSGVWRGPVPQCSRFCKLTPHPSITYFCKLREQGVLNGKRLCNTSEPSDTVVLPECNRPNYYHSGVLSNMRCIDGSWNYVATCQPECGTPTAQGSQLVINGTSAEHGELPWHAGIYDTTTSPYQQICGGSLVSTTVVISAAHCFWNDVDHQLPPSRFAVAVGKIYRPWNNPRDVGAQMSKVSEIRIPSHFSGEAAHFQSDIAVVMLSTPVQFTYFIRPVCVSFDPVFSKRQLQPGNKGKVAGWGLTAEDGVPSQVLKSTELPYVPVDKCKADLPYDFRAYITSDKICAGTMAGTAVCKGDSGGGLAFPDDDKGTQRYYLRGVVSTAPKSGHKCNANSYTTFTYILQHDDFIRDYLNSN